MTSIALTELYESPTNPRKKFAGIEELAESIKRTKGVLSPLLVREKPRDEGGKFEIIFGHRRFRACNTAGLTEVECDVRVMTDVEALEAQLVENVQRSDIHEMEEAEGYDRLMKEAGFTADSLAVRVGKSRSHIFQRLKLLELGPEGRKAFYDGKLQATVAVAVARIPTHKLQAKAVAKLCSETEWSVKNALEWLHTEFVISLRNAPFDKKDDMLLENTPSCVKCPKRSGSGVPGIFDDLVGTSGDLCTDTPCYQAKAKATWEEKAQRHEKAGAEVLTPNEGKKLFTNEGTLKYGTGFVAIDQPVQDDKNRRTWAEILENAKTPPKLVVAPDAELKGTKLYREDDALRAAAELGFSWAKRQQTRAAASKDDAANDDAPNEEGISEKKLKEVRKKVAKEVLVEAALAIKSQEEIPSMVYVLIARAIDSTRGHDGDTAAAEYLAKLKVENFNEWILRAKPKSLLGFIFVALVEEWAGGTWSGFEDGLEATAKAFGLDLKKMVEEQIKAS